VTAVIELSSPPEERQGLGHGYAVEAQIVTWSGQNVLKVPSSALFREGSEWAVFLASNGVADLRKVEIGHDNGQEAEIVAGLSEGDMVVLYPPADLLPGQSLEQRIVE